MPASRVARRRTQVYAQTLFEFASRAGTEAQALDALERLDATSDEVRSTVAVLCELGKMDVVDEVARRYERLERGDDALEEGEAAVIAKTLFAAAKAEGRIQRDLDGLRGLGSLTPEALEVLEALVANGDERLLPAIVEAYRSLADEQGATAPVEVTTAVPLDDELRSSIEAKMARELGRPVYLVEHVDPSIIGGVIIAVGEEARDASVRTQLDNVRQTLLSSSFGGDGK